MNDYGDQLLFEEHRRLRSLVSGQHDGPGRVSVLGWDLEYPSPESLLACVDQILFRRMNDFIPDNDHPVILDCGANIGYTTLHYKRQLPGARITAFEPDPVFLPLLRRNLQRNDAADVAVVDAAAWTAPGRAGWVTERKDGSRLAATCATGSVALTDVRTVDLAAYLDQDIDLLKLDVEGAEFEIVPRLGDRLERVKNVLVEVHITDQDKYQGLAALLTTLKAAGFEIALNSYGPWRDLVRRHIPEPLHCEQYMLLAGWRTESEGVSRESSYMPYVGIEPYRELAEIRARKFMEPQYRHATDILVDLMTREGEGDVRELSGPYRHERGHCWTYRLPADVPLGDTETFQDVSTLLLEDGHLLGPAHTPHAEIWERGGGRYSHWGPAIYLSASDNSDPNTNGRRYVAVCLKRASAESCHTGQDSAASPAVSSEARTPR